MTSVSNSCYQHVTIIMSITEVLRVAFSVAKYKIEKREINAMIKKVVLNGTFRVATLASSATIVALISADISKGRVDRLEFCRFIWDGSYPPAVCFSSTLIVFILTFACLQVVMELYYLVKIQ